MANITHDQLAGGDLHDNKLYPATGTPLPAWTQTDARYQASLGYAPVNRAGDTMTGKLIAAIYDNGGQLYSVRAYGAVGDGVTNDSAAVNAAIAAMGTTPDILFYPSGTYYEPSSIAPPAGTHVLGAGQAATTITSDAAPSNHGGMFNINNRNNITIEGITFVANGTTTAITSYGHDTLTVRNCGFTGTTTAFGGIINLDGQVGSANMVNTLIEGNRFYNNTDASGRVIHIYPRSGHTVSHTKIINNHFSGTNKAAINLDALDLCYDTLIQGNTFIDLVSTSGTDALAVLAGLASANQVYGLSIIGNVYRNTRTGQRQGFAYIYSSHRVLIENNIAVGSWTPSVNTVGPCIAPGRISNPDVGMLIRGNYIEGFDSAWDPDSMTHTEVTGNAVYACGQGFSMGYGTQEYVSVHHNLLYNSPNALYGVGVLFANSNYKKCSFENNIIVEDRVTPVMTYAIEVTGGYNFSDCTVRNNRFYIPNGTIVSPLFYKEMGTETLPRTVEGNEIHDSTGISRDFPYAQGNATGATIFNAANGSIITAILTGSITATLTSGTFKGQVLTLKLTQDAIGSRTATWPSNFKKAGGSLVLSTAANSLDMIVARWDGQNWIEVSRALGLS